MSWVGHFATNFVSIISSLRFKKWFVDGLDLNKICVYYFSSVNPVAVWWPMFAEIQNNIRNVIFDPVFHI